MLFKLVSVDVLAAAVKRELESLFSSQTFVVGGGEEGRVTCLGLAGVILAVCSTSRKFLCGASVLRGHLQPLGQFLAPERSTDVRTGGACVQFPPLSPPGCAVPR